ncbi:hypothetical protein Tco_0344947 [Tanacetum coccineum]
MSSMNTRLNIKKLDGNSVEKHRGSKQVGLKKLGRDVKTGVHGVHVQSVWFEVELHGGQKNQDSNDDVAVTQIKLEIKQLQGKTNTHVHLSSKMGHYGNQITWSRLKKVQRVMLLEGRK